MSHGTFPRSLQFLRAGVNDLEIPLLRFLLPAPPKQPTSSTSWPWSKVTVATAYPTATLQNTNMPSRPAH